MKLSLLFLNVFIALTANAAAIDPNFAYDFLGKGKVGLCPGVSLRVLSAGNVGGVTGDGRGMYSQDFFNRGIWHSTCFYGHEIERCHDWNSLPQRDIRADLEGQLRGFDLSKQNVDPSLASQPLLPEEAALAEQLAVQNAKLSVCFGKLDVAYLGQDQNSTTTKFDLALKYSVSLDVAGGRQNFLVREATAQKTIRSAYYDVYSNYSPIALPFGDTWAPLMRNLGADLKPVASSDADAGLAKLSAYLSEFLGPVGPSDGQ